MKKINNRFSQALDTRKAPQKVCTSMPSLSEDFRTAFRHHPAGVALITANHDDADYGLTVSSVASLSIDPVAVSFSLTKESGAAGAVLATPSFIIHMLGEDHEQLATNFAVPGAPRFTAEQGFTRLATGEPYLPSAPVAFRAYLHSSISVGGSRLIAAEVLEVLTGPHSQHLAYQDRKYLKLSQLSTRVAH